MTRAHSRPAQTHQADDNWLDRALKELRHRQDIAAYPLPRRVLQHPLRAAQIFPYRASKTFPPRHLKAQLFTGDSMTVVLPETVSRQLYFYGFHEPDLSAALLKSLHPGMTFVDVGAHYGYYSIVASRAMMGRGFIYAFEPSPATHAILQSNLQSIPGHRAEQLALSAVEGIAQLHEWGTSYSAYSTIARSPRLPEINTRSAIRKDVTVKTVALDQYFAQAGTQLDWIKIDAESMELEILRGASDTLRDGSAIVSVEVGDLGVEGAAPSSAIVDFMTAIGYIAFECTADHWLPHKPKATYCYGNLIFAKPPLPDFLTT